MSQRCVDCGTTYPDEYRKRWGGFAESDGEGPNARCVALVPSLGLPTVQHPVTKEEQVPMQRCGGALQQTTARPSGLGARIARERFGMETEQ